MNMSYHRGEIRVIGLGPGDHRFMTHDADLALADATDLIGYIPYVERIPPRAGLIRHATDNRVELDRARHALDLAHQGKVVAIVSGGDPGVFAMAAALFEAIDHGTPEDRLIPINIHPGISAMNAAAAKLGAPLGHDFCAISLSDNLKPWDMIARRLKAAAEGDFVIALYNPASKARPQSIFDAFKLLRDIKAPSTPVAFARAVGRHDEKHTLTTLAEADPSIVDMATLVMIGSSETRFIDKPDGTRWLYTPRSYGARP
jgi:precorrin-3B C17-methyltransferase